MSEAEKNVHIYLNKEIKEATQKVLKTASPHERYIILLNQTLQQQFTDSTLKIKDLEAQIETLEEEVDSYSSRKNYLKSLLKNFHEMHKMNEQLSNLEKKIKENNLKFLKEYKIRSKVHLNILWAIFLLIICITWEFTDNFTTSLMSSVIIGVVSFQRSMWLNLVLPDSKSIQGKIKEITTEKKKILKAQDYIHEFIDSQ